jgi:hypothetical protein
VCLEALECQLEKLAAAKAQAKFASVVPDKPKRPTTAFLFFRCPWLPLETAMPGTPATLTHVCVCVRACVCVRVCARPQRP